MPISMFSKKTCVEGPGRKAWSGYRSMCKSCNNSYNKEWVKKRKEDVNKRRVEARHKSGFSKNYGQGNHLGGSGRLAVLTSKERLENKRLHRKKYKYNKKQAGLLTIKTIQLVYEDNIKKYGTLTCYLCKKPIDMQLKFFNKITSEHLEHKTPLSRGGSNDYENLGIACSRCNIRKHDKTVAEYKKYLNNKGVKK